MIEFQVYLNANSILNCGGREVNSPFKEATGSNIKWMKHPLVCPKR